MKTVDERKVVKFLGPLFVEVAEELIIFVDIADICIDDKSPELVAMIDYARRLIERTKEVK